MSNGTSGNAAKNAADKTVLLEQQYVWPGDLTEIPDWVYTDETIYKREIERIFHGPTWNYVALEAEIPNPRDFIRSNVGPTPVVVARTKDGAISVVENRCAHRAAEFCRELSGTASEFICPYHQWTYDLNGNLIGVPFKRGIGGKGGMPKDFNQSEHGLRKLNVTAHRGVVFAFAAEHAILHLRLRLVHRIAVGIVERLERSDELFLAALLNAEVVDVEVIALLSERLLCHHVLLCVIEESIAIDRAAFPRLRQLRDRRPRESGDMAAPSS